MIKKFNKHLKATPRRQWAFQQTLESYSTLSLSTNKRTFDIFSIVHSTISSVTAYLHLKATSVSIQVWSPH